MNKLKLMLINHYASIPRWPGPTRNFDFAANLTQQGWEVTLLSCRFNHYLRSYLPHPPKKESGVKLTWVWSTAYQGNSMLRELNILVFSFLSFWQGLFTPAHVVVTVTPPLESAFFGWLLARVKRIPFVLDVEDLWPDSVIGMGFNHKLVIRWLRFLERFLYRHADHLLVVAQEMKEYLIKYGVSEIKITLIPLGANIPARITAEKRIEIRSRYQWDNDILVAAYVGAHGPANSLETLIQAAKELPAELNLKMVLFGDGSDKPRLGQLIDQLKLNNIRLEDPVAPEKVPEILQAVDIGIASLKNTAIFKTVRPNKIYEYMAVGLPIICCIDGEAGNLVEEIGAGIKVQPEDAQGLAEALQMLVKNNPLRLKLGANGFHYVQQSGDRVLWAGLMGDTLKEVIERR